jgi:N-methylhydantoinase B
MVNHGAFRPLRVRTTPGSVVHVTYPAPANAHSEVRERVISAVMAALSQVAPDLIAADQFGTTF